MRWMLQDVLAKIHYNLMNKIGCKARNGQRSKKTNIINVNIVQYNNKIFAY